MENKITCPVCSIEVDYGTKFCHECSWVFEYFTSEPSEEHNREYYNRLEIARQNWNTLKKYKDLQINIGDYINLGTYYNKPILWRVIAKDDEGNPLLFSEYIITYKPFDAAESGHYRRLNENCTLDADRQKYGSNNWENSNIREWLNSDAQIVTYTTQPPIPKATRNSQNAYASEPGFLFNFTEKERLAIKQVNNRFLLTTIDKDQYQGGEEFLEYTSNIEDLSANWQKSFYKEVKDRVFLLSVEEVKQHVYDRGWNYITKPTNEATENDKSLWKNREGSAHFYWTRCPCTSKASCVCFVNSDGTVRYSIAYDDCIGIRPALFLNLKSGNFKFEGRGTYSNPFVFIS